MSFTMQSTLGEVLDNPTAKAILAKYFPQIDTMGPMLNMVRGMSLEAVSKLPQANISQDSLKSIMDELSKI